MHTRPMTHPAPQELAAFAQGQLAEAAAQIIARHLEGCESCAQVVQAASSPPSDKIRASKVAPGSSAAGLPRAAAPAAPALRSVPAELTNHPKFKLLKTLGRGGMGVVYQAEHRIMERLVAIKVINKNFIDHPEALERFFSEVRSAARLHHPNIVTAYDAEQAGDLHLLVMEYVEGVNLAKYVEPEGPLPVEHACNFMRQAALGLQHAFEQGMVHRDIKPHNLMLTRKGQVKILDFGLARLASERTKGKGLTQTGAFLGTPEYVAPEQAKDASTADIRADIYSLGCTLYFLLTGRPPFQEDTAVKLVLAHLDQEPTPVQELRPEVPVELANVLARMLAKQPAERFQTPVEVVQALTPFSRPEQKIVTKAFAPATKPATSAQQTVVPADTSRMPRARETVVQDPRQVFQEVVRSETKKPNPKPATHWKLPRKKWLAAGIAFLALLLAGGIVIRVATNKGTIKIELSDPKAEVEIKVDGDTVSLTGLDEPLRLKVGDHDLIVTGKSFETITKSFTVKRGDNPVLRITLPEARRPEAAKPADGIADDAPREADRPPASPPQNAQEDQSLPRNRWIPLDPNKAKINRFGRVENDVLILDPPRGEGTGVGWKEPDIHAKNVTIRAKVKVPEGSENIAFVLRQDPAEWRKHYSLGFGRSDKPGRYDFNIGEHYLDGDEHRWTYLKTVEGLDVDLDGDDYFEMSCSAIGDMLSISVNGKRVLEMRDSTYTEGVVGLGSWQSTVYFKEIEVKIHDDTARAAADYDNIATGRWVSLLPPAGETVEKEGLKYKDGILDLDSVGVPDDFPKPPKAKDMILRAKVKPLTGGANLTLRWDRGYYYMTFFAGNGHFGIGKSTFEDGKWGFTHLQGRDLSEKLENEWFEFAAAAVGDRLTVYVNGRQVISVRDSSYAAGIATIWAYECRALFKDVEVQVLKRAED